MSSMTRKFKRTFLVYKKINQLSFLIRNLIIDLFQIREFLK